MEQPDPIHFAQFIQKFADLSFRLVDIGVTMVSADLKGCWTLVFQKRFELLKFYYDCRDCCIDVSVSLDHGYKWRRIEMKHVERKHVERDNAIAYVEAIVRARYPLAPKPPGAH